MKHQYNQGDMIRWTSAVVRCSYLGVITELYENEDNDRYSLYTVTWFPEAREEFYYIKDLDDNEKVSVVVKAQ